jgi:hypothetical protein
VPQTFVSQFPPYFGSGIGHTTFESPWQTRTALPFVPPTFVQPFTTPYTTPYTTTPYGTYGNGLSHSTWEPHWESTWQTPWQNRTTQPLVQSWPVTIS